MKSRFVDLPSVDVQVDAGQVTGPFEWWRHTIGHGGINSRPLPERVIQGARKLKPRLVRTFLQEYLHIYPEHGVFDWSLMDPYVESLAATGAKIVAAITFKPKPLFPDIDEKIYRPNNIEKWQQVITALVQRYSVERPLITYWEIGNETDLGEIGGSPFLINTADSYFEYYKTMVDAILKVYPTAKVGGPALAGAQHELLPGFIARCIETKTQLDFVSWHHYGDPVEAHVSRIKYIRDLLAEHYSGKMPEILVTEWNKFFDAVSVEEIAFESSRAAHTAATILDMMDADLDWSFYYHVWDQTAYISDFSKFFTDPSIMTIHWNGIPHRFGLFGGNEEVRPQYFVYEMLTKMGEEQLASEYDHPALRVRAVRKDKQISVLIVNHQAEATEDLIATLNFAKLPQGRKQLITYRIDNSRQWDSEELTLLPVENREVDTYPDFRCQISSPAETVTLFTLEMID